MMLECVVIEAASHLNLLGCRALIFKEENGECELTAATGRLPNAPEAQEP